MLFLGAAVCGGLGYLFFLAAPRADRSMNRVVPTMMPRPSEEAIRLHATLAVADLHDDVLLWPRSVLERSKEGHVDVPRLIEGKVALQVFSAVTKTPRGLNYQRNDSTTDNVTLLAVASRWPIRTWRSRVERALHQARKLDEAAARSEGRLVLLKSTSDLSRFLAGRA